MSDNNQKPALLSVHPNEELLFEGPYNRAVCKNLTIVNPSQEQSVAFKLKTTSPRMFLVRPNIGILGPDQKIVVDIFMQPLPIVPDANQKLPKFLVQAAVISGDVLDMQEFWKGQKTTDIWGHKIKCELAHRKSSDDCLRQAGGGATAASAPDAKLDEETQFDVEVISEPEAKLLKHVSMLEDERSALKEEVNMLRGQAMMPQPKEKAQSLFKFVSCILTIVAAIVGAYYGKKYL